MSIGLMQMVSIQKIFFGKKKYFKKDCNFEQFCFLTKSVCITQKRTLKLIEINSLLPIFLSIVLNKLPRLNLHSKKKSKVRLFVIDYSNV